MLELFFAVLVREISGDVAHAVGQRLPDVVSELVPPVLLHRLLHPLLEVVVRLLRARDTDHRETPGEQAPERERVQRREELLLRQVTGSAEDDERARVGRSAKLQPLE